MLSLNKNSQTKFALIGAPGSGKSTFASKLGEIFGIPVHHLDRHIFEQDGRKRDKQEFIEIQKTLLAEDAWVVDGCSFSTFEMRFARADVLIYFQFSPAVCILRLFKRVFNHRSDFGSLKTVSWEILKYAWNFNKKKKAKIVELKEKYPHLDFYIFKTQKDADYFLNSLASSLIQKDG